eukprot:7206-Heterococcus_DN1.PRE.1
MPRIVINRTAQHIRPLCATLSQPLRYCEHVKRACDVQRKCRYSWACHDATLIQVLKRAEVITAPSQDSTGEHIHIVRAPSLDQPAQCCTVLVPRCNDGNRDVPRALLCMQPLTQLQVATFSSAEHHVLVQPDALLLLQVLKYWHCATFSGEYSCRSAHCGAVLMKPLELVEVACFASYPAHVSVPMTALFIEELQHLQVASKLSTSESCFFIVPTALRSQPAQHLHITCSSCYFSDVVWKGAVLCCEEPLELWQAPATRCTAHKIW